MARPRNADGQGTRQAILDAALDLFAEKGFFGTSLRDVAAAVGVRESALYNYFTGKDALFEALLADHQNSRAARRAPLSRGPISDGRAVLVLTEFGVDSMRNGDAEQSEILSWQVGAAFAAGVAGTFVFAWTDEWFTGGHLIEDWAFGLVDRERRPLAAIWPSVAWRPAWRLPAGRGLSPRRAPHRARRLANWSWRPTWFRVVQAQAVAR